MSAIELTSLQVQGSLSQPSVAQDPSNAPDAICCPGLKKQSSEITPHNACCTLPKLSESKITPLSEDGLITPKSLGGCIPDGNNGCIRSKGSPASCCSPKSPISISSPHASLDDRLATVQDSKDSYCQSEEGCLGDGCCSDDEGEDADDILSGQRATLNCCDDAGECCDASSVEPRTHELPRLEETDIASCKDACCSGEVFMADESSPQKAITTCNVSTFDGQPVARLPMPQKFKQATTSGLRQRKILADQCCSSQASSIPKSHGCTKHTPHRSTLHHVFGRIVSFAPGYCCCVSDSASSVSPPPRASPRTVPRTAEKANNPCSSLEAHPKGTLISVEPVELGASPQRRKMTMSVQGMDCPSCSMRVTSALLTISSVTNPKVNSITGEATLLYDAGLAIPEEIARRVGVMTGFKCNVTQDLQEAETQKSIKILVTTLPNSWEAEDLPPGVVVMASRMLAASQWVLDVEYSSDSIQPREVIASFLPWGGEYFRETKTIGSDPMSRDFSSLLLRTVLSSITCIPILVLAWAPLPDHPTAYGLTSLALATFIQAYVAAPLYSSSLRSLLLQKTLDMDLLVVLSTTIAYLYSIIAFSLHLAGKPFSKDFFETSALLVTLIMVGRLTSAFARRKATSALDLVDALQVHTVNLLDETGEVRIIPAELVHVGDVLRVYPDSKIPTDGVVVAGVSQVDESSLTGESLPVEKDKGSSLIAGTLNLSGVLDMSASQVMTDNTISKVNRLLKETQDSRLPIQDLADKVASYLAPIVLVSATVTFLIWIFVGIYAQSRASTPAAITALKHAIAVLVVSCPCALALCVPMVVVITVGVGAKQGILFKSIQSVQYANQMNTILLDKTGTLTEGKLSVVESHLYSSDAASLALGLTSSSNHPVAQAIAKHIKDTSGTLQACVLDVQSIPGKGLEATCGGKVLRGGNVTWLELQDHSTVDALRAKALTMFAVKHKDEVIALFGLTDTLRPGALELVTWFKQRNADVYIVSGDDQAVVGALAVQMGLPLEHAVGGSTPQSKVETVRTFQSEGRNKVMFVGDGTNDCLALAQADVGVSISSGTDVAISAADVIMINPANIAAAIQSIFDLSARAYRRIICNFIWAFVYNIFAVLLAAGAFVRVTIEPQYAGLGELVSVLPVILVAWSISFLKAF